MNPEQSERLAILCEECAEVIHDGMKVARHGYDGVNPFEPDADNRARLSREVGNLLAAIDLIKRDLDGEEIRLGKAEKILKLPKYTYHQEFSDQ